MNLLSSLIGICVALFTPTKGIKSPPPRTAYASLQRLEKLVQAGDYQIDGAQIHILYLTRLHSGKQRYGLMVIERQDPPATILLEAPDLQESRFSSSSQFRVIENDQLVVVQASSLKDDNDYYFSTIHFELDENGHLKSMHLSNDHMRDALRGHNNYLLKTEIKGQVERGPR